MKPTIDDLFVEEIYLTERLRRVQAAIEALRMLCEHSWEHKGHDHKDNVEVCRNCQLVRYT